VRVRQNKANEVQIEWHCMSKGKNVRRVFSEGQEANEVQIEWHSMRVKGKKCSEGIQ
jgi:hypothetical protein